MITLGNPSAVVARLNLRGGAPSGPDGGADASVGSGGSNGGSGGTGSGGAAGGGNPVEFAVAFDVDPSANLDVAADRASGATYASLGGLLVKLRPDGTIEWQKAFANVLGWASTLVTDADGSVIVASGYQEGAALSLGPDAGVAPGPGLAVAKYAPDGQAVFVRTWPGGPPFLVSVTVTPGGRILVAGRIQGSAIDFGDGPMGAGFVLSLGPAGAYEWSRGSANTSIRSVASDPQGGAIAAGEASSTVNFGGLAHAIATLSQSFIVRFSPGGTETDFDMYGRAGADFFGATDRAGNLYLRGAYAPIAPGNPPPSFAFPGGPGLSLGLPYFISFTSAGNYRYGSSLPGFSNWISDIALANDGAAWYAGSQRGGLAIGTLFTPDPGTGGLLFRASPTGAVDVLRTYAGGSFTAVAADERGRPVVVGKFQGGVDLGEGLIPTGNPSAVVAKLNLSP